MTRTTTSLLAASILAATACSSLAQTGVPRGGKEITVGSGSGQFQLNLRNDTGLWVEDITIAVYNGYSQFGPNVTTIDVTDINGDKVDDNGNGSLEQGENDTRKDGGASNVVKSIFDGDSLRPGRIITVNVELDRRTSSNTRVMVKFSNFSNGKHWDLLASADFSDGNYECFIPVLPGAPQVETVINNGSNDFVYDLVIPVNPQNPIIDIRLPEDYWNSIVFPEQDAIIIQLDPPLPPFNALDLDLEYSQPFYLPQDSFDQPIFVLPGPPPCRADLNEDGVVDTRDYIEFLNLFNMRDPEADWNNDGQINTLDFLAFQNEWADCR
ncbi:MAG: hypothetical protein HND58_18765 [Planctomycetota bacterium]|nr:MAG: hypothetical protein HND58_18765 [Planctomycetota bacterium]